MLNTELLKNANVSADAHGLVHEVAYGMWLLDGRDFNHALNVLKYSAEMLGKIISDIEAKPKPFSAFEQLIEAAPDL